MNRRKPKIDRVYSSEDIKVPKFGTKMLSLAPTGPMSILTALGEILIKEAHNCYCNVIISH